MLRFAFLALLSGVIVAFNQWPETAESAHHGDGWAVVVFIHDGDTFEVARGRGTERVRMYGVDAPPAGTHCGDVATAALRRLLSETGFEVYLESGPRSADPNGRALYYVWQDIGNDSYLLDDDLVYAGLGYAWRGDGQFRDDIVWSESNAQRNRRGCLWS